jgi:hypothetical protein
VNGSASTGLPTRSVRDTGPQRRHGASERDTRIGCALFVERGSMTFPFERRRFEPR